MKHCRQSHPDQVECEADDTEQTETLHTDDQEDSLPKKCKLTCPVCSRPYSSQSNLNRHVKAEHPQAYEPSHNSIDCPKCDMKFTRMCLLTEHLEEKHNYQDDQKELLFPTMAGKLIGTLQIMICFVFFGKVFN